MKSTTNNAQIRLSRLTPAYWRITFDNPPLNLMGPEFVLQFRKIVTAIETDEQLKVVVFDSAVEGFFLNHSDFLAKLEDLTGIPPGPTGLPAWPDILVRRHADAGHLGDSSAALLASSGDCDGLRMVAYTLWPARPRVSAVARPIPVLVPVISTDAIVGSPLRWLTVASSVHRLPPRGDQAVHLPVVSLQTERHEP